MKITPVDNTNFNGKFINNALLEKVLNSAEEYDLKKFSEVLDRMQQKDDGREFWLNIVASPVFVGKFLHLEGNKNFKASRYLQIWDIKTGKVWRSVLHNINGMLNAHYPEPPVHETLPKKEKLLKEIHEKLAVNI